MSNFGAIVIVLMLAGLTQEALAQKCGTTQSSIARAERGASLPGHTLLKKIAKAIGTTLLPPKFAYMERRTPQFTYNFNSDAQTTTTTFSF